MKGKMSKDIKKLDEYPSTKILLEYSAFWASTRVLDYSLPSLLYIVEKWEMYEYV
jgi:acyl-CoA-binding protein